MLVLKAQIRRFLVWISISAQINDWCSNANLPWESMLIFVGHIFQEVFVQFKRKMENIHFNSEIGKSGRSSISLLIGMEKSLPLEC